MKITKDIWILLTEYDELSQIEIIFYKNSTNLVKPYLYYTNKSNASLLKMDENDFVFFSKIDIEKNSEFKFAIIGEQEVIKYEIFLGNNSEDCYLIRKEKCESEIKSDDIIPSSFYTSSLKKDIQETVTEEINTQDTKEVIQTEPIVTETYDVNTDDTVEPETEETIDEQNDIIETNSVETVSDENDIIETVNVESDVAEPDTEETVNIENDFVEPKIEEAVNVENDMVERDTEELDDNIDNTSKTSSTLSLDNITADTIRSLVNKFYNVDIDKTPDTEKNKNEDEILENLIKDFTMPIDISNVEVKNIETTESNSLENPSESDTNESINIEDTSELNIENIFNITNTDNDDSNIIDIPVKKAQNEGKHCKISVPKDDKNLSFQNIIDTIDNFDFSFDNNIEENTTQESQDNTFVEDSIKDIVENNSENNIENSIWDSIVDNTENDIEDNIEDHIEDSIEDKSKYIIINDTVNIENDIENFVFDSKIKFENIINNSSKITATNNEERTTNNDIDNEIIEESSLIDDIINNTNNTDNTNTSLIVSENKQLKFHKRQGLRFSYKMNKKIKITLIKLYRNLPNFLKGDYRRRINL